ncbi:hypothetical protein [uncultured Dokdonia sp.]|uniref:hypothetical protein n=1 Tax=uncultured Dokdonia sp. TaxID=575653 RepID=UPI00261026D8|nr:hypothetical protein [uncultured Dokdonia sp.]
MLRILIIALFLCSSIVSGQSESVNPNNNILVGLTNLGSNRAAFGSISIIRNNRNTIDGTVYLYDEWSNDGTVSSEETSVRLDNLNFNAQRNAFQSQIGKDSIFTFNFRNLKEVHINDKKFKSVFSPVHKNNRVFEVLAANKDFSIYKDYRIEIKEGNPNPQRGSSNDKFLLRYDYYVQQGENFDKFQLKKSKLLKVMGDKATEVETYIKSNKLKVKKAEDFSKIMDYYNSL